MFPWHTIYNISLLRQISFNMDYYWSNKQTPKQSDKYDKLSPESYQKRVKTPSLKSDFTFINYFTYVFYVPLYIAGPIIPFNAWMSQVKKPQDVYKFGELITYAIRWLLCLVAMEILLHFLYPWAFSNMRVYDELMLNPVDLFPLLYWQLNFYG
eukprot:UN31390